MNTTEMNNPSKLSEHLLEVHLHEAYLAIESTQVGLFDSSECHCKTVDIVYALRCYLSEEGTTTKQNELLRAIGVKK